MRAKIAERVAAPSAARVSQSTCSGHRTEMRAHSHRSRGSSALLPGRRARPRSVAAPYMTSPCSRPSQASKRRQDRARDVC